MKKFEKLSCLSLFIHALSISAFSIGGGYVMIPLMKERFVEKLKWIDGEELIELTALGQSCPGAMVINTNVIMGYRLLGLKGALAGAFGTALPPLILLSIIGMFYEKIRDNVYVSAAFRGMRAGVAAVIADVVVNLIVPYFKKKDIISIGIMSLAFIVAYFLNVNVAIVIISCGGAGMLMGYFKRKKGGKIA